MRPPVDGDGFAGRFESQAVFLFAGFQFAQGDAGCFIVFLGLIVNVLAESEINSAILMVFDESGHSFNLPRDELEFCGEDFLEDGNFLAGGIQGLLGPLPKGCDFRMFAGKAGGDFVFDFEVCLAMFLEVTGHLVFGEIEAGGIADEILIFRLDEFFDLYGELIPLNLQGIQFCPGIFEHVVFGRPHGTGIVRFEEGNPVLLDEDGQLLPSLDDQIGLGFDGMIQGVKLVALVASCSGNALFGVGVDDGLNDGLCLVFCGMGGIEVDNISAFDGADLDRFGEGGPVDAAVFSGFVEGVSGGENDDLILEKAIRGRAVLWVVNLNGGGGSVDGGLIGIGLKRTEGGKDESCEEEFWFHGRMFWRGLVG